MTLVYTIGKNLIVNGNEIYTEIDTAIGDYKSGNWKGTGFNIGEALGKVLGEPAPAEKTIVEIVNEQATTWVAVEYEQFAGLSDTELQCYTGLIGNPE